MLKCEKNILSNASRAKALKKEITNLTTLKLKTINQSEKTQKRLPGKLFASHISNKGLVTTTYQELSQIKIKFKPTVKWRFGQ